MTLCRDDPGSALALEDRRGGWETVSPTSCLFFLLMAMLLFMAVMVVRSGAKDGAYTASFVVLLALLPLFFLGDRAVRLVTLDRDSGEFHLETLSFGLFRRRMTAPLSAVHTLALQGIRSIGCGFQITLLLRLDGGLRLKEAISVESLDKPEEVMDLAFRMGAILGLTRYRIDRSDPRELWLTLGRKGGEGLLEVPTIGRPADYSVDRVATDLEVPEQVAETFDPTSFPSEYNIAPWSPGHVVRFEKKPISPAELLGCLGLIVLAGACGWWLAKTGASGRHGTQDLGISLFLMSVICITVVLSEGLKSKGSAATMDWGRRRIAVTTGRRTTIIPLDEVVFLLLRGLCERVQHRHGTHVEYRCELHVAWRHRPGRTPSTSLLVATNGMRDRERAYRAGWSLSTTLARSLRVPLRYSDFRAV